MQYLISFLEGIITFISPCLLPMLPIYITYFAGGGERKTGRTLTNALGFVAGFTILFVAMGALAGTLGGFLVTHRTLLNVVSGAIVIAFGLSYLGLFNIRWRSGNGGNMDLSRLGFFSSMVFGFVFAVGWTPCVGAFLGSALMLASQQGSAMTGILMLLAYSAGLGLPFLISAVLIDHLKSAFDIIKKNYAVINKVCGGFLVVMGILMATGYMGRFLALLS